MDNWYSLPLSILEHREPVSAIPKRDYRLGRNVENDRVHLVEVDPISRQTDIEPNNLKMRVKWSNQKNWITHLKSLSFQGNRQHIHVVIA